MKLLFVVLVTLPSLASAAPFTAPAKVYGTDYLYRGAQPIGHADVLQESQIAQVLIYKNDVKGEVVKEIAELKAAGYNDRQIYHVPMKWKDVNPLEACQQTIEALQILVNAEKNGINTYFHCTAGEDRTGMIAALSRMLITRETTEKVFVDEMCDNGYSDGNPNKPAPVTQAIERSLTPLFFGLAEKIESGALNTENLLPEFCANLDVKKVLRKCN